MQGQWSRHSKLMGHTFQLWASNSTQVLTPYQTLQIYRLTFTCDYFGLFRGTLSTVHESHTANDVKQLKLKETVQLFAKVGSALLLAIKDDLVQAACSQPTITEPCLCLSMAAGTGHFKLGTG